MAANQQGTDPRRNVEITKFNGINTNGAPFAIADQEFQWLEELVPVAGTLMQPPGPGAVLATLASPAVKMWGYTINDTPYLICACQNNTLYAVNVTTGAISTITAITSPTSCDVTVWQNLVILVVDSGLGYFSWNGTATTTISATQLGTAITVFSSRVWIANNRTITFTAPVSYTDFTVADAAGSFVLTDSAFIGPVTALYSALEQLWIFGQNAINVLSNVTVVTSTSTTMFSNSNLSNVEGCYWPRAIAPQLRSLTFANPNGMFMLTGLTPTKISEMLNGMFPQTNVAFNVHAAQASFFSSQWLCFLVNYTGSNGQGPGNLILLLDPSSGWGVSRQGGISAMATAWVSGSPVAYGAQGDNIVPLFSNAGAVSSWSLTTKLYDMNEAMTVKEVYRLGGFAKVSAGGLATIFPITENGSQGAVNFPTVEGTNFYGVSAKAFGRGIGMQMNGRGAGGIIYSLIMEAQPRSKW